MGTNLVTALMAISASLILPQCSSDRTVRHSFQVEEVEGILTVMNSGGPMYSEELFRYEKILELEEGQMEEALFYQPSEFLADETGRFFLKDSGLAKILVFDPSGNYLNSIGQRGQGPGEFIGCSIQSVNGGIVTIFEAMGLRRIQRFSWDGPLIDVTTVPSGAAMLSVFGAFIIDSMDKLFLTGSMSMADPEVRRAGSIVIAANGDTIADVMTPYVNVVRSAEIRIAGNVAIIPSPLIYGPNPMSNYHPNHGIVLSSGTEPVLKLFNLEGTHIKTITVDLPVEPVTAADEELARNLFTQVLNNMDEGLRDMMQSQIDVMKFADEKAPWTDVKIDDDGYFWLQIPAPLAGREQLEYLSYRVLSPEGEYLGITQQPNGSFQRVCHGRLLILVEDPESGAIVPTVYQIVSAVPRLVYP